MKKGTNGGLGLLSAADKKAVNRADISGKESSSIYNRVQEYQDGG